MEDKTKKELETAREHFLALRLLDAYSILRRYYDRLPFRPEPEHAKYIGIFVRTLYELGKKTELQFYVKELEKHYGREKTPEIAYQLAVLYSDPETGDLKVAMAMLEQLIRNPHADEYRNKAKIYLAYCYDTLFDDVASCRRLIDSVDDNIDTYTAGVLETWKAKILRDEGKLEEAESLLKKFLDRREPSQDWYSYGVANILLAGVYMRMGSPERAVEILSHLEKLFEGKPMKSLRAQMLSVEQTLRKGEELGKVAFQQSGGRTKIRYASRSIDFEESSATGRLFFQLATNPHLDKEMIIRTVYDRAYEAGKDDQLVYYHIHNLRKQLKKVGVPGEAIVSDGTGYRFVAEAERIES